MFDTDVNIQTPDEEGTKNLYKLYGLPKDVWKVMCPMERIVFCDYKEAEMEFTMLKDSEAREVQAIMHRHRGCPEWEAAETSYKFFQKRREMVLKNVRRRLRRQKSAGTRRGIGKVKLQRGSAHNSKKSCSQRK